MYSMVVSGTIFDTSSKLPSAIAFRTRLALIPPIRGISMTSTPYFGRICFMRSLYARVTAQNGSDKTLCYAESGSNCGAEKRQIKIGIDAPGIGFVFYKVRREG